MPAVFLTRSPQMRLSRRNRYGAVPPTNITYAHAINICQKAKEPDLEGAEQFLAWASDDGVEATVFMYASAIWTAQRAGSYQKALELFNRMETHQLQTNAVVYNGLFSAVCDHGNIEQALDLFEQMKARDFELSPGSARVSGIFSASWLIFCNQLILKSNATVRDWQGLLFDRWRRRRTKL